MQLCLVEHGEETAGFGLDAALATGALDGTLQPVVNQRKKSRDKKRTATTGASRASAATGKVHLHEPLPDMTALGQLPCAPGRDLDTGLAARLVAACRAACQPCRTSLAEKIRTEHWPTLAALASAVYGELTDRAPAASASPTTRSWAPLARAAKTGKGDGSAALAAVEAMDDAGASDLLDDVLGHWAVGTPLLADFVDNLRTGVPRHSAAAARHSHPESDTGLFEGMLPLELPTRSSSTSQDLAGTIGRARREKLTLRQAQQRDVGRAHGSQTQARRSRRSGVDRSRGCGVPGTRIPAARRWRSRSS